MSKYLHYFLHKSCSFGLALTLILCIDATAQYSINTVAGNGSYGFSGDGGPAVNAAFTFPNDVAVDGAGNLYIADPGNHRIRKVNAIDGKISTIAGTGISGYSGDGGAATSAQLYYPFSVDTDGEGNLYIIGGNRIRKVSASDGTISTVAGDGTSGISSDGVVGTSASITASSVIVDGAGNIYFSESFRIRKISVIDGKITTLAGNGIAGFSNDGVVATSASISSTPPLALDGAGNLYFSDNRRIRRINASDGTISTVAGNGIADFSGDGGPAINASVYSPSFIAADVAGNIYFSEYFHRRVRKVNASDGIINTIIGNGTYGFSGDGGLATNAQITYSYGITVDGAGNVYFIDAFNQRVRKASPIPPTITLGSTPPICQGATSFEIHYTATTYNPDHYTVTGTGVSASQTGSLSGGFGTITVGIDPATFTGSFSLIVKNIAMGIPSSPVEATVSVKVPPTATISGTTAVIQNAPAPVVTFNASGGTPPYTFTYQVNGGGSITINTGSNSATVAQPTGTAASYVYNLLNVSDTYCGQDQSGTATVTVNPPYPVNVESCKTIYMGYGNSCVSLTASVAGDISGITYSWQPGNLPGPTVQVCPATTTTYTVRATDAYGNNAYNTATVAVIDVRCGNKNDKVQLCHQGNELCVAPNAVSAHLAHGDKLGGCQVVACGGNHAARVGVETEEHPALLVLSMQVYPNPTQGLVRIQVQNFVEGEVRFEILDLIGRSVQRKVVSLMPGIQEVDFDLRIQPAGLYLIRCYDRAGRQGIVRVSRE